MNIRRGLFAAPTSKRCTLMLRLIRSPLYLRMLSANNTIPLWDKWKLVLASKG